jgi:hypothetical protein
VTYDDNLADLLGVGVDSGTLRIQLKPHATVRNRPTLRAAVTVAQLEAIQKAPFLRRVLTGAVRRSPGSTGGTGNDMTRTPRCGVRQGDRARPQAMP